MRNIALGTTAALLLVALPSAAKAQFDDLLRRIPPGANAILVIDVKQAQSSPIAVKEGWAKQHEAASVARPIVLPSEADKLVLAAQLDASQDLGEVWELAVMNLREPMSLRSIARSEGGYIDKINGLESVWTPSEAYFVSLNDKSLGVMHPANRQFVSRWAEFGRTNQKVVVSPYLRSAAGAVSSNNPIVMAIDLTDVVRPHKLNEALENSEVLKGEEKKVEELAKLIPKVQGITLKVALGETAKGTLQVDFGESTAAFGNLAKPLLLEALDRFEADIDDVESWNVALAGNSVTLNGPLSENGMRRLFSLLEIPTTKFATIDEQDFSPGDPQTLAKIQKTYFDSVNVLMDDLGTTLKKERDNHATYMERYARKIDRLPILNVDEELLTYGATVAEAFRNMALAKRGAGLRTGVQNSAVYGNYVAYGNYGYGYRRDNTAVRNQNRVQEQAQATSVRLRGWTDLENLRADTRRALTKKYQIEF